MGDYVEQGITKVEIYFGHTFELRKMRKEAVEAGSIHVPAKYRGIWSKIHRTMTNMSEETGE